MWTSWIALASASWWVWVVAGFAIGVVEVLVPGFIFLGFAIGAVLTGILIALGLLGSNVSLTILIFSLFSLAAWFGLHRTFASKRLPNKRWDTDIND